MLDFYRSIFILIIIGVFTILFCAIFASAVHHRLTKQHQLSPLSESIWVELSWMTVPAIIVIGIMLYTYADCVTKQPINHPNNKVTSNHSQLKD